MDTSTRRSSSSMPNMTIEEIKELAHGWSIKEDILGKNVFNENNDSIGIVEDLLVTRDTAISYAVIGVGGFIGIGRHDVAIPVYQLRMNKSQITLPGATTESLKALQPFEYQ